MSVHRTSTKTVSPAKNQKHSSDHSEPLASQFRSSPDFPGTSGYENRDVPEETLIIDARGGLSPAQLVEDKLISLLKSVAVPVSHARMTTLCKGRNHC